MIEKKVPVDFHNRCDLCGCYFDEHGVCNCHNIRPGSETLVEQNQGTVK